ncbi:MAG: hypothetical protein WDO73_15260 [Ignavibacteriota bacterium]
MARRIVQVLTVVAVTLTVTGQPADSPAYRNPDLAPEKRAADLVGRMTLAERFSSCRIRRRPSNDWVFLPTAGGTKRCTALLGPAKPPYSRRRSAWPLPGTPTSNSGSATSSPPKRARSTTTRSKRDNHGRYFGLTFWSPNINIFRDPRWGRGRKPSEKIRFSPGGLRWPSSKECRATTRITLRWSRLPSTTPYTAVPSPIRHRFNVQPSERDLNSTYLPAFRAAVKDGKVDSIMCAYTPSTASPPAPTLTCCRRT